MLAIAPAAGAVKKRKIGNFDHPVYVTGAPGFQKLEFVVEQPGSVRVVKGDHKLRQAFLNIRGLVGYDGAERGLLSIAFPPDYKQSGRFYVDYTDKQGDINVVEYQRRSATKARRRIGPAGPQHQPSRQRKPQRGSAAIPRQPALHLHR